MKNKKGFTLVELLVSVAIIISILAISIIAITKTSDKQKQSAKKKTDEQFIAAAKQYLSKNEYLFSDSKNVTKGKVYLKDLVNEDYLSALVNPETGKKYDECDYVEVTVTNGKATYNDEIKNDNEGTCENTPATFTKVNPEDKKMCTIHFDPGYYSNDLTVYGEMSDMSIECGAQNKLKKNEYKLLKNGTVDNSISFELWQVLDENNDVTKTTYEDEALVTINTNITLRASWYTPSPKLTLVKNDGSGENKTILAQGIRLNKDLEFQRDGYKFTGWNTDPDGKNGVSYKTNDNLILKDDLTLYAQWEKSEYTIKFYDRGNWKIFYEDTICEYDKDCTLPYYNFSNFLDWWYKKLDTTYGNGATINLKKADVDEDVVILYANYKPNVMYYSNDENDNNYSHQCGYDQDCKLRSNSIFTRNGYEIVKWNTKPDGSGTSYLPEANIKIKNDITLYAQWKKIKHEVKFDANCLFMETAKGASIASLSCTLNNNYKNEIKTIYVEHGEKINFSEIVVPDYWGPITRYYFTSWYKEAYNTNYDENPAYDFNDIVTDDFTLYAHWAKEQVNVTFKYCDGSSTKQSVSAGGYVSVPDSSKTWYYAGTQIPCVDACPIYLNNQTIEESCDVTPEPKNSYSVSFNRNGATSGTMSSIKCNYDENCQLPINKYKKDSSEFSGWQDQYNSNVFSDQDVINYSKGNVSYDTVTLKALWEDQGNPNINIKIYNSSGTIATDKYPSGSYNIYGEKVKYKVEINGGGANIASYSIKLSDSTVASNSNYNMQDYTYNSDFLNDGTYTISVEMKSNGKQKSVTKEIIVDTTKPTVSISDNGFITGNWITSIEKNKTIGFNFSDNLSGLKSYTIYKNAPAKTSDNNNYLVSGAGTSINNKIASSPKTLSRSYDHNVICDNANNCIFDGDETLNNNINPNGHLHDGYRSFKVIVCDYADNCTEQEKTVKIDTLAPNWSIDLRYSSVQTFPDGNHVFDCLTCTSSDEDNGSCHKVSAKRCDKAGGTDNGFKYNGCSDSLSGVNKKFVKWQYGSQGYHSPDERFTGNNYYEISSNGNYWIDKKGKDRALSFSGKNAGNKINFGLYCTDNAGNKSENIEAVLTITNHKDCYGNIQNTTDNKYNRCTNWDNNNKQCTQWQSIDNNGGSCN